jgi:hypothetical protein
MIVGAATILGINAYFWSVQQQLGLGVPWYFPYWVTTSSLTLLFIFVMLWLISQRQLLPGIVIMGAFILFILWIVGLIVYSVQLWGPSGVNGNCQLYVNDNPYSGQSVNTLGYLEQHSICQGWIASWAFMLIGTIFLLWMMIIAYQVYRDDI